jgi:ABC-type nitrate/sulfonate/bicarbonate transport system substrate-binding protein
MRVKKALRDFGGLAVLVAFLFTAGSAVALEKLRVPVASPTSLTSLIEHVAMYHGFFKDIGYDARIYSVSGGESAAVLALEKGQLPFFNSDDNFPLAIRPKSNIRVVANTMAKLPYFLAAGPDVKSYKDLPRDGIRVGISSPTSGNVYVSLILLEKNGIKNPRLLKVGGSTARLAAVKAGKVDVGSLTMGPMLKAKEAGLTILGSAAEVADEFVMMQVAMNKNWAKENPQKAIEIVGTFIRGCDYVNRNRKGTIEVLVKAQKNKPENAAKMYDIGIAQERMIPNFCQITEKGVQAYMEAAKWSKAINPAMKIPPTSMFTMPDLYQKGLDWFKKHHGR